MKSIVFLVLALFIMTSCSTHKKEEREIEAKAAQSKISDPQAFGGTIQSLIRDSKTLSEGQKQQIEKIFSDNKLRADELLQESFKYRSVLVQELLSERPDSKRLEIIKKDIKKIEDLRLKNTFDTVEKVSAIVSKQPNNGGEYSEHLIHFERFTR